MSIKKNKSNSQPAGAASQRAPKGKADLHKADSAAASAEGDEEEEDEEEEDDGVQKGADIALDDLEKGLQDLAETGKKAPSRKKVLLQKALDGEITAKEQSELKGLMDGTKIAKSLVDDDDADDLRKGMDVSPALDQLATKMAGCLDTLNDRLEKGLDDAATFNGALADSLVAMGKVLRAQNAQITQLRDTIEKSLDAPARAPTSNTREMSKALDKDGEGKGGKGAGNGGGGGGAPVPESRKFTKVLEVMWNRSVQKGLEGRSESGVSIKHELAKASSNLPLDPRMLNDIRTFEKSLKD